ncbi:Inner membrane protein YcfT [Microbacterium trichothecenolyticum]|uniref:Inner membrane protein YcfT n=2 Tax=Microbacterium trichothecenolyticum TaxID=69370 RepID=A0A0M2H1T6_MICTR|nr:Inner membrane protein YcfT [Microbacterium trichothecenolyticum]
MTAAAPRVQWIDIAKGVAIALVVLHHSLQFLEAYGWVAGPLQRADTGLTTMRMPLFFAVSGLLAAGAIRTLPFGRLWRRRLLLLAYLYVLWGLVRAVWFSLVPWPLEPLDPWMQFLVSPVQPWSGLWYLYALVLYSAAAWAMRRLPAWLQLTFAGAVSVLFASGIIQLGTGYTWRSIGTYFFFFVFGMHGRELLLRWAERVTWPLGIGVFAGYGALTLGLSLVPSSVRWAATLPVAVLGVAAGVALAVMLSRIPVAGNAAQGLGARTLPVYVLHVLVISALAPLIPVAALPTAAVAVGLAAVAIAVALALYAAVGRVPGLFSLPPGIPPLPRAEPAAD